MTPEPWLRGTLLELDPLRRQVLHALELTAEDVARWCAPLSDAELNARPFDLPPLAFHLRHIARSLDRLLTYAEGHPLSPAQTAALETELHPHTPAAEVLAELHHGLARAAERLHALPPHTFHQTRGVGRLLLPTTVAGLLIHCAEHTQRHAGQAITTAKLLLALRKPAP